MKISETNIIDTFNKIDGYKIELSEKVISSISPLFNDKYKKLLNKYNEHKRNIENKKNILSEKRKKIKDINENYEKEKEIGKYFKLILNLKIQDNTLSKDLFNKLLPLILEYEKEDCDILKIVNKIKILLDPFKASFAKNNTIKEKGGEKNKGSNNLKNNFKIPSNDDLSLVRSKIEEMKSKQKSMF